MFESSSHIDPRLQEVMRSVEEEEIGLRVVSAELYNLPYIDIQVTIEILEARAFNILEEFILRAAHMLQPQPTREGLAAMLGLDRLFVDASWQRLAEMEAVVVAEAETLCLTEQGRDFYLQGQLPPASHSETLDLRYQVITDQLAVSDSEVEASEPAPLLPGYLAFEETQQEEAVEAVVSDLSRIIAATREAGLSLHVPEDGRTISSITARSITDRGQVSCALLVVQDTLVPAESEDNISLRIVDPKSRRRNFAVEEVLRAWIDEGRVTLAKLVPPDTEEEVELSVLAEPAITHYRGQMVTLRSKPRPKARDQEKIGVELLRDEEIRPRFLAALDEAQHTVLIYSPWISEVVIDDAFIDLLEDLAGRRVITLVGWGIAHTLEEQNRRPSESLIRRLHRIRTPEGIPAVIVQWVGNQHSKDVLVDYRVHMSGSQNWLSYRGDHYPRGETTYRVTEPGCVKRALDYMEKLFAKAADERWRSLTKELKEQLRKDDTIDTLAELERCCVTWVVARQPKIALRRVPYLPSVNIKILPTALRLISTTCLSLLRLPDDMLAQMLALSELEGASEKLRQHASKLPTPETDSELARFEELSRTLISRLPSLGQSG
jgi:hypothetical protein